MKTKKDKCHLIVSNNKHIYINIHDIEIESSHWIIIDSKLSFKDHLNGIIKKTSRKVNAFSRITHRLKILW